MYDPGLYRKNLRYFDHFMKALRRLQKSNDEESFETKALDLARMGGKRLGIIRKNVIVYENQKIWIQFTPFDYSNSFRFVWSVNVILHRWSYTVWPFLIVTFLILKRSQTVENVHDTFTQTFRNGQRLQRWTVRNVWERSSWNAETPWNEKWKKFSYTFQKRKKFLY